MKLSLISLCSMVSMLFFWAPASFASETRAVANASGANDILVKFTSSQALQTYAAQARLEGAKVESLGGDGLWAHVVLANTRSLAKLRSNPTVSLVQGNTKLHLLENYQVTDPAQRARLEQLIAADTRGGEADNPPDPPTQDNPPIPLMSPNQGSGADPFFNKQWGMNDIGTQSAWKSGRGAGIIVAVIDSGVDYTHEDLIDSLWHNPGEMGKDAHGNDKATNQIDDDGNGYIDDVIGWDFADNDNKPYDMAVKPVELLMGGGNPGHGTHCTGNVAAQANNGIGISGVAPEAKVMALRFITQKGEGSTAAAVQAINYAVKMGAKVLSNSWGSEGDDPSDPTGNQALKDAITNAMNHGVLFVAAAGNGHQGVGYDNDTDPKPSVPATYAIDNIVSVAALDNQDNLGAFSNWGVKTVHLGAPGVDVFSSTVGGHYSDVVIDMYGMRATWDGTSMACPHVAGAAALYWSTHPTATWKDVKNALLSSTKPLAALKGKTVSGGKLNVESLMTK